MLVGHRMGHTRGRARLRAMDERDEPGPVVCTECGRRADDGAKGWRALRGRGEPGDQPEVFVFCPECAAREFGRPRGLGS